MTRRSHRTRGIALIVCASAALVALPATAGAQSAVDEYTLDIPGGGSPSASSGGPPAAGAAGSGASGSGGKQQGEAAGPGAGASGSSAGGRDASGVAAGFAPFHEGVGRPIDTSSRSAPEVVADTLLDGAMLPLLGALVLITGVGAWRVLRHRRTLTGAAS